MVSAIAAVVGLLLAVFGIPLVGGSPVNRTIAEGAGASRTPASSAASSTSASPETYASDSPARTAEPGTTPAAPAPPASSAPPAPSSPPGPGSPSPPPAMPHGWHRVNDSGLTVAFAVPDGWIQKVDNDIQNTWRSPDEVYEISVKRDTSYGSTPQAASAGQLAWYRNSGKSSMTGLAVATHATRQNGRDALWLDIDYHWVRQSEPRNRVEVFVAGHAGHVYQLLLDTADPAKQAEQRQLFATARAQLLIDQ